MNGGKKFHTFALASHTSEEVTLHLTVTCVPIVSRYMGTGFGQVPVAYRFMGFSHTVSTPVEPVALDDTNILLTASAWWYS